VSNFGTGSKYDLKTEEAYNAAWADIESEIHGLDEKMFQIISKQDD
jgi:hypothetical protein